MAVLKPTPSGYFLWDYVPSRIAAIAVAALFLIGTLAVIWRSIRTRTKFAIPFIISGTCKSTSSFPSSGLQHPNRVLLVEIGGYAARAAAQDITDSLPPYIAQSILILVAPALFAASIYMILGRVIRSTGGERHSLIQPERLTRIFVAGDVVSFLTQVIGGGLQAVKSFNRTTAERIVLGGLLLQILIFGIFAIVAMIWHRRMKRRPTDASLADTKGRWESIMYMLYGVSVLIMMRSVFRVIEYAMGRDGYLLQHEWTMYVFDSALMVITVFVFAWWYPGLLRVPKTKESRLEMGS